MFYTMLMCARLFIHLNVLVQTLICMMHITFATLVADFGREAEEEEEVTHLNYKRGI